MVALVSPLVVASCSGVAEQHSESASPSAGSDPARMQGTSPAADAEAMLICVMERPTAAI
jgi:hypothetical protein